MFGHPPTSTRFPYTTLFRSNGSYTVTLTVTDSHGAASGPATTTATIANVAPVVSTAAAQTATAGSAFTFSASFSDAGVNDGSEAYAIDWEDGTHQTSGSART